MLDAARAALRFTEGLSLQQFLGDENEMARVAVERKLEVIGEAARRLSAAFRENHPDLPWRDIIGLRNVISHEYDRVSYEEVYRIVRERVPALAAQLALLVPRPPATRE
jgi:uncharacterized protein with HEPN domain